MKTHLLTKKRALISSVAMLLVAIIALGTATFAWFTQNTQATADKLSVKTIKASELQVSKAEGGWSDQIHYDYMGKVLKPASSVDGKVWTAAVAAKNDSYAAGEATDISSDLSSYVFKDQLNVRNNGKAGVENVKIKFSFNENEGGGQGKYARLALVEARDKAPNSDLIGTFKDNVYAAAADSAEAFVDSTKATEIVTAKPGADAEFDVGALTASGTTGSVKYYNLYVWFEGQDTDCKDVNGGNEVPEITFTVTGNTVNQQTGN